MYLIDPVELRRVDSEVMEQVRREFYRTGLVAHRFIVLVDGVLKSLPIPNIVMTDSRLKDAVLNFLRLWVAAHEPEAMYFTAEAFMVALNKGELRLGETPHEARRRLFPANLKDADPKDRYEAVILYREVVYGEGELWAADIVREGSARPYLTEFREASSRHGVTVLTMRFKDFYKFYWLTKRGI